LQRERVITSDLVAAWKYLIAVLLNVCDTVLLRSGSTRMVLPC
jgi:hypothetical protein